MEHKTIQVPEAIKRLIISNNILLQNYQQELTSQVQLANKEMMQILGLDPADGWRLDMDTMTYIKQEQVTEE